MKTAIIGSGNVATHLAKALHAAQFPIAQVWSANQQNAAILAKATHSSVMNQLHLIDPTIELCIIAVKDDAIATVADQLKGFKGLIVHTAGAVPIDVFAGNFENYGVLYPLQTFSKHKTVDFKTVPLCIEANGVASIQLLHAVARQLSGNVQEIDGTQRKILHLAAVFACNFPNHLFSLAEEILDEHQLDFNLLRPLILETASKVQQALPADVQTGPAIRNDVQTLAAHQALLAHQPKLLEIYQTLSESIKKTR
ncbi:MAG: DUF2520 domain-containing protein [Pedobacter sp.]|nr:DUF2520 domain-containing protein [Pedobacter sp.]